MYVRSRKLFSKDTKEGVIMLSRDESEIFTLNETAARIWKFVASRPKSSVEDILNMLKENYSLGGEDIENCEKDCLEIIKENPDLFEILDK